MLQVPFERSVGFLFVRLLHVARCCTGDLFNMNKLTSASSLLNLDGSMDDGSRQERRAVAPHSLHCCCKLLVDWYFPPAVDCCCKGLMCWAAALSTGAADVCTQQIYTQCTAYTIRLHSNPIQYCAVLEASDMDIAFPAGAGDDDLLKKLRRVLPNEFAQNPPDLVLYGERGESQHLNTVLLRPVCMAVAMNSVTASSILLFSSLLFS